MRASSSYSLPRSVARHVALVAPLMRLPTHRPRHRKRLGLPSASSNATLAAQYMYPYDDGNGPFAPGYMGASWPSDCGAMCHGTYEQGGSTTGRFVTPEVLRMQYNLGPRPSFGARGSMAIASFQEEFWAQPALDFYSAECDLPRISPVRQIGGNHPAVCLNPQTLGQDCTEGSLDVEVISAVGGAVPLTVFYHNDYSIEHWVLTLAEMSDEELPLVHSVSYGDDEVMQGEDAPIGMSGEAYMHRVDTEFIKLGLRGASIMFAAGDQGTWGDSGVEYGTAFHADYPAASPWVTAVGGTDLKIADVIGEEQVWASGGGGFSSRAPMPDYQHDAVTAFLQSHAANLPNSTLFKAGNRGYPDVAMLGGLQNAYCIVTDPDAGWEAVAGTSAASPAFAGVVAKLNDARLRAGMAPMGFINPFLYSLMGTSAFNDVTVGENKDVGYVGFRPVQGWDAATGLGTPNYQRMEEAALASGRQAMQS